MRGEIQSRYLGRLGRTSMIPKACSYRLFNDHEPDGRLHRENSREEGDTGQYGDIQPLPRTWPIHWVSRILGLWLLPADLYEALLILNAYNTLFIFLAPGRVVRIAGLIFARLGILGLEIADGGLRFFRFGGGLRWRGGVR